MYPLTNGPEERGLLRAVCETPDDDTPRLVYADWLEENSDRLLPPREGTDWSEPEDQCLAMMFRSDFIKASIFIHHNPGRPYSKPRPVLAKWLNEINLSGVLFDEVRRHASITGGEGMNRWILNFPESSMWDRGFPTVVGDEKGMHQTFWVDNGPAVVLHAPVTRVRLYQTRPFQGNTWYNKDAPAGASHKRIPYYPQLSTGEDGDAAGLPECIFRCLPGVTDQNWVMYPRGWSRTDHSGYTALNLACLNYARGKAGLPLFPEDWGCPPKKA